MPKPHPHVSSAVLPAGWLRSVQCVNLSDVSHVQIAAEMLCNNVVKDLTLLTFGRGEQGLKGGDSLGKRLFTSPFPPKMSIPIL